MSMNNNRANCWLFYFIRKRCNQASIKQRLKWTHTLQLSLSGHLTSPPHTHTRTHTHTSFPFQPSQTIRTNHLHLRECVARLHMEGSITCVRHEEGHESPSYGYMSHALSTDVEGTMGVSILIELTCGND